MLIRALLALALFVSVARASEPSDAWRVTRRMVAAPFRGSARDYSVAAALAAGVVFSSALDKNARREITRLDDPWVHTVNNVGHAYQGPIVIFGTAGGLYALGLVSDNNNFRRTGIEIVESFAFASAGTHIGKRLFGRHRPYLNDGPYRFSGPHLNNNAHMSLPSGDVTVAFSFASVIAAEAKRWPVTVAAYGLGAMTAFQRVQRNQHWFSDTAAAAVWGTAVGLAVVHFNRTASETPPRVSLQLSPASAALVWTLP